MILCLELIVPNTDFCWIQNIQFEVWQRLMHFQENALIIAVEFKQHGDIVAEKRLIFAERFIHKVQDSF